MRKICWLKNLRLEPLPIFHQNVNKGKSLVFNYESAKSSENALVAVDGGLMLMEAASKVKMNQMWLVENDDTLEMVDSDNFLVLSQHF